MRSILFLLSVLLIVHHNSANFDSDLLEFIELVPKKRIAYLWGRHFLFDAKFRKAINYLRSQNFKILVRDEISKSPEIQDVIKYLGREIDLNMIPIKIRGLTIQPRPAEEYGNVRGSSDFVQEISDLLPDSEIANLIKSKSSSDPVFADLVSKLTDIKFKELVYKARNSKSMVVAVDLLKCKQVELDRILEIAFTKIDKWKLYL